MSWLSHYQKEIGSTSINSLQDIWLMAPAIYERLSSYEASTYSKDQSISFDKNKLITCIKEFREKNLSSILAGTNSTETNKSKFKAQQLEPFYK